MKTSSSACGWRAGRRSRQLDETVERSLRSAALWDEVKDRLHDSAFGLSGGQQQRLCIARAIANQPEILLMDEPCAALDPLATLKIEELILELKKQFTIVIVTHNMEQASRCSDRTAFLYMGKLVEYGETLQVFENPRRGGNRSLYHRTIQLAMTDAPSSPVPPPVIEVRDMDFSYGKSVALKNIDMTIARNEITAFIGPSGCGKSTLLRCFNRMNDLIPGARVSKGGPSGSMASRSTARRSMASSSGARRAWFSRNPIPSRAASTRTSPTARASSASTGNPRSMASSRNPCAARRCGTR